MADRFEAGQSFTRDDRDGLVDQLRPVMHKAICEQVGTVVGLPDAVLVATKAVIDAGWRPPKSPDGDTGIGAARLQVLWLGDRPVLVLDKADPGILDQLDAVRLREELNLAGMLVFEREVEVL